MKGYLRSLIEIILVVCCTTGLVACGSETSPTQLAESEVSIEVTEEPVKELEPYVDKLDRSDEGKR